MSDQSQEKQKAEQAYQVRESLIDFPTDFPIKVMGKKTLALKARKKAVKVIMSLTR